LTPKKGDDDENEVPESPESIGEINETTSSSAEVEGTCISPDHGTDAPVQQSESSQSQSAAQAHSIWTVSPKRYRCSVCGKELHAQNAVKRHLDDVHSDPKKCSESGCNEMIIGKRKLKVHLKDAHNIYTLNFKKATGE
jgi:uncharacterized Zn-finger protein